MKKLSLLLIPALALVISLVNQGVASAATPAETFCASKSSPADCESGYSGALAGQTLDEACTDPINQSVNSDCADGFFAGQAADSASTPPSTPPSKPSSVGSLPNSTIKLENPIGKNADGTEKTLIDILQSIFRAMRTIMFVIVPIFIVVGAFQMLMAAGNPEQFKTGQKTILYSVIGLVIILMATGVVALVKSILTV